MEFRDLKKQYQVLKPEIDAAIGQVLEESAYIGGKPVAQLEAELAEYVGVKHCITCANGTDALILALITRALPLVGIDAIAQNMVKGILILVVVVLNVVTQRMMDRANLERREM